jgi:formylglycine-generating enzyme required for sulfatase activity
LAENRLAALERDNRPPSPYRTFSFTTAKVDSAGKIVNSITKQGEELSLDLGSGLTLELVRIPAGKFLMGSPADEAGRSDDEGPQREVNVGEFLMGKYEVTIEQWRAVSEWPRVKIDLPEGPSYFKDDWKQPVEQVSWDEAAEFCARLTRKFGATYRLPSEAEWEYAARAGTTTRYAFGHEFSSEIISNGGKTIRVGSYPANGWGLFDMHGNVWEWCQDVWHSDYNDAPKDGRAWVDISNQTLRRVFRGGAWGGIAVVCRSAYRNARTPGDRDRGLGFRLSRTAK